MAATRAGSPGGWSATDGPGSACRGLGGQGGGLVGLALTAELLAGAGVPSATWLATALAVPALGPRTGVAAFEGEHAALLSPADAIPGAGPRLTTDGEGRLRGTVPRVLAGDLAARFVAVAGGPGGSLCLRLVPAGAGVQAQTRRMLDRGRPVADVAAARHPGRSMPTPGVPGRLRRACRRTGSRTRWERWRGCSTWPSSTASSATSSACRSARSGDQARRRDVLVEVEAARSAVYFAAASVDSRRPQSALHAAAVKAQVTACGARVTDSALTPRRDQPPGSTTCTCSTSGPSSTSTSTAPLRRGTAHRRRAQADPSSLWSVHLILSYQ